ncbi:MAG: hypothetical protein B6I34_02605 [Anaerolineaceae bacterium 4572_32.1]|nr:MAG: hypothetical protein B6I34_02605 [Anaerolineaceae bacterium 4572_32.1]
MSIDTVAVRLDIDDRVIALQTNLAFRLEIVLFHLWIGHIEIDVVVSQRLHGQKLGAVFGYNHLDRLHIVLVTTF